MLLVALSGEPTCPEVLVPVCRALAAGRPLEAAELAEPIARDAFAAPQNRRAAAAIAVGAWIDEGSPAARCKAKALLTDYFAAPNLPRTPALERRRTELALDDCESHLAPNATPASPPPQPETVAAATTPEGPKSAAAEGGPPPPPVTRTPPVPRRAQISDSSRLALGGALVGVGVGFGAVTIGALAVLGHEMGVGRDLVARAEDGDRKWTDSEAQRFDEAVSRARQARWVALGVGLAGAATLGVGIPLVVSARRALRLQPYMRGGAAGVIFSGAF
ncbi:hypothetical protein [Nannocystis pusilla]|uniref:Uncharacterized protein n=1 Tax=Nannocystis pusilla TaxID=889268 RepID=A0ABS7U2K4_9BACT|nr:hypothetical protein [Nannocystis pusilla]MBZ5714693.1 hypothetical protein [Nannocystis pusilla]